MKQVLEECIKALMPLSKAADLYDEIGMFQKPEVVNLYTHGKEHIITLLDCQVARGVIKQLQDKVAEL